MQLDWDKAINDILAEKMTCQGCGALGDEMVVGYTRNTDAAEFARTSPEPDPSELYTDVYLEAAQ